MKEPEKTESEEKDREEPYVRGGCLRDVYTKKSKRGKETKLQRFVTIIDSRQSSRPWEKNTMMENRMMEHRGNDWGPGGGWVVVPSFRWPTISDAPKTRWTIA